MPTLEQFVATGLTPATQQSSCAICLDDPCVDPVAIACNHIFCHDCILTYSNAPTGSEEVEEAENIYDTAHNFLLNLAHRDEHARFRMQIPTTTTRTTTSTTATTLTVITGSGRWPSNTNLLCTRVQALGYLVRARQQVTPGQVFSARLVSDWEEILSDLTAILRKFCENKTRKVRKVSRLEGKLIKALKREWKKRHGRYAVLNAFLTQPWKHCVQVLVEFVEYLVWMEGRRVEIEWEREGYSRCYFM